MTKKPQRPQQTASHYPYQVDIEQVRQVVDTLPGYIRQRVKRAILDLRTEPRPPGFKALQNELAGYTPIRLDNYRIIYFIHESIKIVEIVKVALRDNNTYKNVSRPKQSG